jgi:hypothetical protein
MKPFEPVLDQERGEFDSASKAELARLCAGRFALVKDLRAAGQTFEEDETEAAVEGEAIHAALAGLQIELPSDRATRTFGMCRQQRRVIVEHFTDGAVPIAEFGEYWTNRIFGRFQVLRELRLWYRVGLQKLFSGQADLIIIDLEKARALIVDYKSGIKDVPAPARNEQLRALVVLLKHNVPELEAIACEVLQPWVTWETRFAEYAVDDLTAADREVVQIYSRNLYDYKRAAGLHCAQCEARARCATAVRFAASVTLNAEEIEAGRLELPTGAKGDQALDKIETVEKIFKAIRERYKAELIKDSNFLPGRKIAEGVRSLTSVAAAWQIIKNNITRAQFDECCSVQITDLENLLSDELNWPSKSKAEKFNKLFADVLKRGEPRMLHLSAKEKKARAAAALPAPVPEEAINQ